MADRVPEPLGSKVTWKVVLPLAVTGEVGNAVTVKSAAWVPLTATKGVPDRVRLTVPLLAIVKVRTTVPPVTWALPKSVWSVVLGVLSPSGMPKLLTVTVISGAGRAACTATVWKDPAATDCHEVADPIWTGLVRSVVVPSPNWPNSFLPHAQSVPSVRTATVWLPHAATDCHEVADPI